MSFVVTTFENCVFLHHDDVHENIDEINVASFNGRKDLGTEGTANGIENERATNYDYKIDHTLRRRCSDFVILEDENTYRVGEDYRTDVN